MELTFNLNSLARKHPGITVPAVTTAAVVGLGVIVGHMGEKWNAIRALTAGLIGGLICLSFKGQMAEVLDRVAGYLRNSGTPPHPNGNGGSSRLKEAVVGPSEWVDRVKSRELSSGEREHVLLQLYHPADRHRYAKAEAEDFYKEARGRYPEALEATHGSPERNALVALAQRKLSPSFGFRTFADTEAADLAKTAKFHKQMLDHDRARFVAEVAPTLHPAVLKALARLEATAYEDAWNANVPLVNMAEGVPLMNLAVVAHDRTLGHTIELSKPGLRAVLESVAERLFQEAPKALDQRKAFLERAWKEWKKVKSTAPFREELFQHVALLEARAFDAAHYGMKEQSGAICALGAEQLTEPGYEMLVEIWVDRTWRLQARQSNDTRDIPGYRATLMPKFRQLAARPLMDVSRMLERAIARSYLRKHYDQLVDNDGKVPESHRVGLAQAADLVEEMIREDRTVRGAVGGTQS